MTEQEIQYRRDMLNSILNGINQVRGKHKNQLKDLPKAKHDALTTDAIVMAQALIWTDNYTVDECHRFKADKITTLARDLAFVLDKLLLEKEDEHKPKENQDGPKET